MKVGGIKDPLYKDSYFRIAPPTFIPPLEPFEFVKLLHSNIGALRIRIGFLVAYYTIIIGIPPKKEYYRKLLRPLI